MATSFGLGHGLVDDVPAPGHDGRIGLGLVDDVLALHLDGRIGLCRLVAVKTAL